MTSHEPMGVAIREKKEEKKEKKKRGPQTRHEWK
jgi:hypothetical protein